MSKFTTKFIGTELVAKDTNAFYFEKPQGFSFKAGQSMDVTLMHPNETDAEGNSRSFSLASSPEEDMLTIATRMRDTAFKRTLRTLPKGTEVEIEGPFGSMTLHNDASKPAVLLAGGIGITPFFSMAKDAVARNLPHKIFLFYSNRTQEDAPYLEELQNLAKQNPNFTLIATMTGPNNSTWQGETGYINADMVKKFITNVQSPIYYIAGPSAMAVAMQKLVAEIGGLEDNIRIEEFAGY